MKKILLFWVLLVMYIGAKAQVHPVDGDTVNYRMVGFEFPAKKNVTEYVLEVYEEYVKDDGGIFTRLLFEQPGPDNKIIATIPAWAKSYKWRVKYREDKIITDSTKFYHFTTGYSVYGDTNKYRMRILTNELGNRDYFIFVDGTRTLYDLDGNAIWYLPDIPGLVDFNTVIRDIELTPFNTITFLAGSKACEIDFDANILWKAPDDGKVSGDSSEHYHHDLTRLNNGNYMIIGAQSIWREVPDKYIMIPAMKHKLIKKDGKNYRNLMSATLIEYDTKGKVVWSWQSNDIFTDSDLFTPGVSGNGAKANTHMNAFYFNEKDKTIYTSHRNINRIVKIAYPSGKVLANYGEAYHKEINITGDGLFHGQHNCRISRNGELYLFNNNMNHNQAPDSGKEPSSIIFLKEPKQPGDTIQQVWSFYCNMDTLTRGFTQGGGGVHELGTGDVLVCMAFGRNFIVSKSKKIIWDALLEQTDVTNGWKTVEVGYRNDIVESVEQLKALILGIKNQ